jgi:hypothetical protein
MKIQTLVFTLVMSCVSSLSLNTAMNQNAVAQTAAQRQQLKAVGLPLVLPSYRPSGYQPPKFKIFQYKPSDGDLYQANDPLKNYHYRVTYEGPNSCNFSVATGPGVGDQVREKVHPLGATVFGSNLISEVFEIEPRRISFIGNLPNRVLFFNGGCKSSKFSLEEGKKIVRSLRIVS